MLDAIASCHLVMGHLKLRTDEIIRLSDLEEFFELTSFSRINSVYGGRQSQTSDEEEMPEFDHQKMMKDKFKTEQEMFFSAIKLEKTNNAVPVTNHGVIINEGENGVTGSFTNEESVPNQVAEEISPENETSESFQPKMEESLEMALSPEQFIESSDTDSETDSELEEPYNITPEEKRLGQRFPRVDYSKLFDSDDSPFDEKEAQEPNTQGETLTVGLQTRKLQPKKSPSKDHRVFNCENCAFSCAKAITLEKHVRTFHTSEKRFACSKCPFRAKVAGQLQKHIKEDHTGEKPYACQWCDYRAGIRANMTKHLKKYHSA